MRAGGRTRNSTQFLLPWLYREWSGRPCLSALHPNSSCYRRWRPWFVYGGGDVGGKAGAGSGLDRESSASYTRCAAPTGMACPPADTGEMEVSGLESSVFGDDRLRRLSGFGQGKTGAGAGAGARLPGMQVGHSWPSVSAMRRSTVAVRGAHPGEIRRRQRYFSINFTRLSFMRAETYSSSAWAHEGLCAPWPGCKGHW